MKQSRTEGDGWKDRVALERSEINGMERKDKLHVVMWAWSGRTGLMRRTDMGMEWSHEMNQVVRNKVRQ